MNEVNGKGVDDDGSKFEIQMVIAEASEESTCWHGFAQEPGKEVQTEIILPEFEIPFKQDPEISPNPSYQNKIQTFECKKPAYTING